MRLRHVGVKRVFVARRTQVAAHEHFFYASTNNQNTRFGRQRLQPTVRPCPSGGVAQPYARGDRRQAGLAGSPSASPPGGPSATTLGVMSNPPLRLVITSVPPGEAPEWVRKQWVGLSLPLAQQAQEPRRFLTSGVMTGPRGLWQRLVAVVTGKFNVESGYLVECSAALAVLEAERPDAAAWWKENLPHHFRAGRRFVFRRNVGHVIQ